MFVRALGGGVPAAGVRLTVLEPGQPNALYHSESRQEAFLVLHGTCRLLVDGEERLLHALDEAYAPFGESRLERPGGWPQLPWA